ncbi:MAG: membrane protein insertase YidC [Opitutaceae bacterium]
MDKKNTVIGVLLLAAAIALLFLSPRIWPPQPLPPEVSDVPPVPEAGNPETGTSAAPAGQQPASAAPGSPPTIAPAAAAPGNRMLETVVTPRPDQQFVSLSNEFVEVRFTNYGGAIAEVVLKKYPKTKDGEEPYVWNSHRATSALSLIGLAGADGNAPYTLVSQTADTVVWQTIAADQIEVTRSYRLISDPAAGEPYELVHETTFRNLLDGPLNTPQLALSLGTAEPVDANDNGQNLNVGAYDGEEAAFIGIGEFVPGFFARNVRGDRQIKSVIPLVQNTAWASVKNQFFTAVLTPEEPAIGVSARRLELPLIEGEAAPRIAITGAMQTGPVQLPAGGSETLTFDYYAGPKEYDRLAHLGANQDEIMQFGFFGFFAKMLLYLLKFLQQYVGNWGVAIICTTVILRTLMWPLTASAARSAKRMGKIQGPMKEIQEKHKDNKQKQQEAMLALFKEHKVNPVGGCLPMFLQIPIFFGLFTMLRSASELRFAEFLWVPDLSAPDTVAHLFGFPINIMPLLMGASMVIQMRMTPTPTVDNPTAKMMKFMPYFVTFMCYTFSSGLAVYWTASNIFSIFQQWVTNRSKDPVVEKVETKQIASASTANKPVRIKKKR